MLRYQQTTPAPDFDLNLDWLNCDHPISISELRGRVVLLDFWTYCCINCQHVLPKLAELEKKYSNSLAVIGVHSAKFRDQSSTDGIRQAVLRHNIEHPVVNDRYFGVWAKYAIQVWPTIVMIDPEGFIVDTQSGESAPEKLDPQMAWLIEHFSKSGKINSSLIATSLERNSSLNSFLRFPSKVLVDERRDRLFIADSNHNRIIVANRLSNRVQAVIGSGETGSNDGDYVNAQFNHPQGMELVGEVLYIADTRNHLLRAVDLVDKSVITVAGTGDQGGIGHGTGEALTTPLSSPWDLAWDGNRLYMAMAGPHQMWYFDPATKQVGVWAGTGQEDLVDAPLREAALAQPSGVTFDERNWIYFADSEVSAIRGAQNDANGLVKTVIGRGLFEFGDIDGEQTVARLQHPLGVAWHDGRIFVADTYNHKIKIVDPGSRTSMTYAGSGTHGLKDGPVEIAQFNEPGGIAVASDGTVYVADTNNHAIRVIDPESAEVSTFSLIV